MLVVYVDIGMPIVLLGVILAALFLNDRVENKLKSTVEEKEFSRRDILMLVAAMAVIIVIIAVSAMYNPADLFTNIFVTFFVIAYSILLFTIAYVFSDGKKKKVQLISGFFGAASLIFAVVSLLSSVADKIAIYRSAAFFGSRWFLLCHSSS